MAEDMVVKYCAPTLAGIKTGGLFSCPFQDVRSLRVWLRQINRRLAPKGVRVLSLRYRRGRALIYVYRPGMLCRDLKDIAAIRLLSERGYDCESPGCCIARLARILSGSEPFPHEIGLFLGYPPEDVLGFIENKSPCKCTGCWKVYGDVDSARITFTAYKNCTEEYCSRFADGSTLEDLAVAI